MDDPFDLETDRKNYFKSEFMKYNLKQELYIRCSLCAFGGDDFIKTGGDRISQRDPAAEKCN